MKTIKNLNLWLLLLVATIFTACKNQQNETRDIQLLTDSTAFNNYADTLAAPEQNAEEIKASAKQKEAPRQTRSSGDETVTTPENNTGSSSSTAAQSEKKGWSKAAQGAVIGGAAGAVGGAIISKKKGKGAVIGAAAGAVGGYIIGREKDKKDGRVKDNN